MKCAECENRQCYQGKDCPALADETRELYRDDDLRSHAISTAIESRYYGKKTRLEEVVLYASAMGYEKIGIAFCIGMANEAAELSRVLGKHFQVHSVCCKVCGIDKKDLGLETLHSPKGMEAMCNPMGQAEVLNRENTDLNLMVGLCVGHDAAFIKSSKAPVSPFIVKDRVLGHNPAVALYSNYYRKARENMEEMRPEDVK